MNLINQAVKHKILGKGTITAHNDSHIIVTFANKELTLVFPDAFVSFLKCDDAALQAELEAKYAEKKAKQEQEFRAESRAIEDAIRAREERALAEKRKNSPSATRQTNKNNIAFKCTFCNGGTSNKCIGYKGVCSDEQIKQNIKDKKPWCSNQSSYCYKYANGKITRQQLDEINSNGNLVCYESVMLLNWDARAGEDLDDNGVHKARRIVNATPDSLCVLTTVLPEDTGKDRVIFGAFIIGSVYPGDDTTAGSAKAKDGYCIELTRDEAKQMKFWDYHKNPNKEDSLQWGEGLFRYLNDTTCISILEKIVSIKKTKKDKAQATKILDYYRRIKGL